MAVLCELFLYTDLETGASGVEESSAESMAFVGLLPISYSVDGRQYVAVSSANVLYSFALPE